jgi:predicted RNA binding protein YcfA (HicA-like mRNA interferase family)
MGPLLYALLCTVRASEARDLVQQLNALGWFAVRQGKHEIFGRKDRETTIPVLRHAEITEFTARAILRKAKEV